MIYVILEVYKVFQVIICDMCNFRKCIMFFRLYYVIFVILESV